MRSAWKLLSAIGVRRKRTGRWIGLHIAPLMLVSVTVVAGCGGDSRSPTGPSQTGPDSTVPPTAPGSSNVTIYTNQGYPEFLTIRRPDGGKGIYLGQKNGEGLPTQMSDVIIDARDGDPRKQGRIRYGNDGRPLSASLASGDQLQFDWSSSSQASMTMVASDGSMLLKTPISIQGAGGSLAGSRVSTGGSSPTFTSGLRIGSTRVVSGLSRPSGIGRSCP